MATWIVHLRVAERLLAVRDDLDPMYTAVGSIAPDSGIPDETWETFDPPSEITHFRRSEADPQPCADLAFYRDHVLPAVNADGTRDRISFLLGYFSHLVVDNLWHTEISLPAEAKHAEQFAADPRFIWEVKRDWYGLDFEYVRAHSDSLFWTALVPAVPADTYLEFLPLEAVGQRLDYIKTFYQRTDEEVEERLMRRERIYLTHERMDGFVERAADRFLRILDHLTCHADSIPSHLPSALDLPGVESS